MREKDTARFWAKVNIIGHNDCWEWRAGRFPQGYGAFWLNGHNQPASRIAWILCVGEIPETEWVLHRCDNPPCCNPAHLFPGTAKMNTQDMIAKGRDRFPAKINRDYAKRIRRFHPRGEKHWAAGITDGIVIEMRSWFSVGARESDLAYAFEVNRSTARYVLKQGGWAHLPPPDLSAIRRWCRNGHEYTPATVVWYGGKRSCRICNAAASRRAKERKRNRE